MVDRVEVDVEYSSPGLAVVATITSTASSNSISPFRRQLTANFGLGRAFDGGTNAGGWLQEESPPSPDGSVPHCERCGRKGHVARIWEASSRFEGIYDTCGQYGHRMRYCIRNQPAPHAHVVAAPVAPPPPLLPPSPPPRLAAAAIILRKARMAMAAAMAPTAVVRTITTDTAMPTMKRCQLDSHLAPAPAPVMTYHHGRREPLMATTIELCSWQATEEMVPPFRLETGATRMKGISVVLFPSFSVARNRVMAPLLISCSFQPAVAAAAPAVISRGPRRSTAVVTTATAPIGVRSSSTAAVVVVIVRNHSCDTTAAATVQHCGRSSSMTPAPSVALAGSRGALAAMDRR